MQYEIISDSDLAYVTEKVNGLAGEGWRVHTFVSAAIQEAEGSHPASVVFTALLERETTNAP